MSAAIAQEAQTIVQEAAGPAASRTIARQIDDACRALGYPRGSWRVSAAWYLQAGCWSAAAVRDLQQRYLDWRDRRDREAAAASATRAAVRAASDHHLVEDTRAELAALRSRIDELEQALRL